MARLISAMLLAFVLGVPSNAAAACAWVLWEATRSEKSPLDPTWTLKTAHETRRECQAALAEAVVRGVAAWQEMGARLVSPGEKGEGRFIRVMADGKGYAYVNSDTGQLLIKEADCLPDTIDPRGPKGK